MNNNLLQALIASFVVSAITLPIGAIFLKKTKTREWLEKNFISLCAGVMLGNALTNLLPEALHLYFDAKIISLAMLLGILAFFLLEKAHVWFHHHDGTHGTDPTTNLVMIGDSVHNFIDGIAIALAFLASTKLGIVTTLAIMLHEIPTELSDLSLLINKGMQIKKAIWYNFFSGLTSIAGTAIGFTVLADNFKLQAIILAALAGMFIYISCSDLIPDMHTEKREKKASAQILIFLLGIALTYLTS